MGRVTETFKALSDPNRTRILKMLQVRPLCVCEITELLGLATSRVSKHLSILRNAGFLLGMPGSSGGIIPNHWIASLVGGNSLGSNFFASIVGTFMYFATLTENPILQGLISNGMGQGPALALLLAGPAVSLPNLLVIRSVIGAGKTSVFFVLVVIIATSSGMIFGILV